MSLGEFEIIARYFQPLAEGNAGALGLKDDAALLTPAPGNSFVVTTDTMIAGVHYFESDPPELVGRKLLRVNLSDLAAMGATPTGYFLSVALRKPLDEPWLASFCGGLAADQKEFGVALCGGDTVATSGPAVLTVTAVGEAPEGAALMRSGAKSGDDIYVSGTVGDAALGFRVLLGEFGDLAPERRDALVARYHVPVPRLALGVALRGIARAAIDISDGLAADMGHICDCSGAGAEIEWARLPLSEAARAAVGESPEAANFVLAGGDDYELLFTAPPGAEEKVAAAGRAAGVAVTKIGRMAGQAVVIRDENGAAMDLDAAGYTHFGGP